MITYRGYTITKEDQGRFPSTPFQITHYTDPAVIISRHATLSEAKATINSWLKAR